MSCRGNGSKKGAFPSSSSFSYIYAYVYVRPYPAAHCRHSAPSHSFRTAVYVAIARQALVHKLRNDLAEFGDSYRNEISLLYGTCLHITPTRVHRHMKPECHAAR